MMFRSCQKTICRSRRAALALAAGSVTLLLAGAPIARAQDVSAPATLEDFENQYSTIDNRMPDIFAAGYGAVYLPPPGRAQSGNQSVGYDAYNRFDLGSAGNPTLYGTQAGLQATVNAIHTMGGSAYVDLVWHQSGFADDSTSNGAFAASGGYPGLALTLQTSNPAAAGYNTEGYNVTDGDYYSAYDSSNQTYRLAGLVTVDHATNNVFIRQPTTAGNPDNIPGPAVGAAAYDYNDSGSPVYANVPEASNAQYYPDTSLPGQTLYDPKNGNSYTRYPFNLSNPMNGTPVAENALGYLMRNTQWLVQTIGVDGFRIDAAYNTPSWVFNYLDDAVYDSSNRYLLNGQQENIFSFSEVYTGDIPTLESYIRKDINPSTPGVVGGDRDDLDFPLFFAMQSNLTGNGYQNNWFNVYQSSLCYQMTGLNNGAYGVSFVSSQDDAAPYLGNIAYAYTLMMPGNTIVYDNGHEFGNNRSFPQDGRGDALGGVYGNAITTLVDLRNRYGRGDYSTDYITQNDFAFEREDSALVMLDNSTSSGDVPVTIDVHFAPGTPLIELSGNAASTSADPQSLIPQLIVVNSDSGSPTGASVNVPFLRNSATTSTGNTYFTGDGYLVYGPSSPQGSMNVSNVSSVMAGSTPNASTSTNLPYDNGTTRLSNIDVITSGSFTLSLNTTLVNLLGFFRDKDADGDNAVFKIDSGIDVNGLGLDTNPGDVTYGFEQFANSSPGYFNASGNGTFSQSINTAQLADGYHYITIDAFRHRNPGEPAIYTDWKQTIYVDLHKPVSEFSSSTPTVYQDDGSVHYDQQNFVVQSVDELATSVNMFLDLPPADTNAQILAMVNSGNLATQTDVNLFQLYQSGVTKGNHVITAVTWKPDGNYNIQRFTGIANSQSPIGAAMGDVVGSSGNGPDGYIEGNDVLALYNAILSKGQTFYPEDDFQGNGQMTYVDWVALGQELTMFNDLGTPNPGGGPLVSQGTIDYYNSLTPSLEAAVPEPTSAAVLLPAMFGLLRRRNRRSMRLHGAVDRAC
jgi:alpha-amylase